MNFRSLIGISLLCVALTGCGGTKTVTYTVTTNVDDPSVSAQLYQASERVIVRRLAAADVKDAQVKVVPRGSGATMTVTVTKAADTATLERILNAPFSFDIRKEGPKKAGMVDGETNWIPTGVDGSMLTWISPIENPTTHEIGVDIVFNEKGRTLLQAAFKGNKGKEVGIFVRDLLVSKMTIAKEEVSEHIIISGIPNDRVAQIFSDDVNVGLHVTFTPSK
jgi:preprotein translocase subunit SecD